MSTLTGAYRWISRSWHARPWWCCWAMGGSGGRTEKLEDGGRELHEDGNCMRTEDGGRELLEDGNCMRTEEEDGQSIRFFSAFCHLSSVICPLSSVFCRLSSVFCPLSSVLRLLPSALSPQPSVLRPLTSCSFWNPEPGCLLLPEFLDKR